MPARYGPTLLYTKCVPGLNLNGIDKDIFTQSSSLYSGRCAPIRLPYSCPKHIVSRSRTVAAFKLSSMLSGRSPEKASVNFSFRDINPSCTANPTAQDVKLLVAEYIFLRHSSSLCHSATVSLSFVILMPRTLRPLAISINSEIFIAAFTIPSIDVN